MHVPFRILVVDDEYSVRIGLLRVLCARGYDAIGASSGADALQKALAQRPDAIVMDMMMPGENGADAADRMRAYTQLADVPIIALTASPSLFLETQGFHSVLIKPCLSIDLLAAIVKATNP
jgi:two-component system, OmpR family, response regulator MprA